MRFLAITLVLAPPDAPADTRLRAVVDAAARAEELGFDGFGVGERHERPFLSAAPPVLLAAAAQRTTRIRLFTAVTTLSLLDPVRAYEDYATLDALSGGRLELIIGKGNGAAQASLFGVTADDQWDRNREGYELFRRLWREDTVTWSGRFRPPLTDAEVLPRPVRGPVRVWHGSATSRASVELAARHGDPLFSANVTGPIDQYADLIDHYRERLAHHGHDPATALIGAGTAGLYVHRDPRRAVDTYRPVWQARTETLRRAGVTPTFADLEDAIARGSLLVGSPGQIIDKVHRYHQRFGHHVMHLPAEPDGLSATAYRDSLELFFAEVAPVLRAELPSPAYDRPAAR